MSQPNFAYEQTLNVSFAPVDAEMALYVQLNRSTSLSVGRFEDLPGRLVIYNVYMYAAGQEYGDCGRIFIQYLEQHKTRLSIEVNAPDKYGAARFAAPGVLRLMGGLNPEKLSQEEFERGYSVLYDLRLVFLKEIILLVIARLPAPEPVSSPVRKAPTIKKSDQLPAGRPGLPVDEKLHRLALVLLESKLKQRDPGLTRGEFIFQVQEKLKIPLEIHTVKNAHNLLERARKNNEQDIIALAEKQAQEWQILLE